MFLCSGPWKPLRGHKSLEDHPTLPLAMWGHELFEAGGGGWGRGLRFPLPPVLQTQQICFTLGETF